MKKARKMVSALLAVCLLLTAAPLSGLAGLGLFSKAQAYAVGDHIQYGNYPQSRVTDTALIASLDAAPKTWKSYHYYSGDGAQRIVNGKPTFYNSEPSDFMRFADLFVGGNKYRAVTFSEYRSYCTDLHDAYSYQKRNGYEAGRVYYFLYEPVLWRVLDPSVGLILSEKLLDAQAYQNTVYEYAGKYYNDRSYTKYACDYESSSIRAWLNTDFLQNGLYSAAEKQYSRRRCAEQQKQQ